MESPAIEHPIEQRLLTKSQVATDISLPILEQMAPGDEREAEIASSQQRNDDTITPLYHLYLKPQHLQLESGEGEGPWFFDEANRLLVLFSLSYIRLRTCLSNAQHVNIDLPRVGTLENIPRQISSVKFSPDGRFIALQPSKTEICVFSVDGVQRIIYQCPHGSHILRWHWTCGDHLCVVTTTAVELIQLINIEPLTSKLHLPHPKPSIKLVKELKFPIGWAVFSVTLRMLIISVGGKGGSSLQPFFLQKDNLIKLPKFDVDIDDSQTLRQSEITICRIYGRIYCVYLSGQTRRLALYQILMEGVTKRHQIQLLTSGPVSLSVVDNLLVLHDKPAKISIIYDIMSEDPQYPLAGGLPLAPLHTAFTSDPSHAVPSQEVTSPSTINTSELYNEYWRFYYPNLILDTQAGYMWEVVADLHNITQGISEPLDLIQFLLRRDTGKPLLLHFIEELICNESTSLSFLSKIFDIFNRVLKSTTTPEPLVSTSPKKKDNKTVSREGNVDTPRSRSSTRTYSFSTISIPSPNSPTSLTSSSSPTSSTSPNSPNSASSPSLSSISSSAASPTVPKEAPPTSNATTRINRISNMGGVGRGERMHEDLSDFEQRTKEGHLVISQHDLYTNIFLPMEEQDAKAKCLLAVLTEYLCSLNLYQIVVEDYLYKMLINLLIRHNRFYQLHQFIQYHVIDDSIHVACQLLSLEKVYPPSYQLALDMLKRLSLKSKGVEDQIIEVLLTTNQFLEALRFIRGHPEASYSVLRFLEASHSLADNTIFYSVYRFFEKRGEITPECALYTGAFNHFFKPKHVHGTSAPSHS